MSSIFSQKSLVFLLAGLVVACSPRASVRDAGADGDADSDHDADGDDGGSHDADAGGCICAPGDHQERIYLVSDDAELWAYDPRTDEFELITLARCFGGQHPYSMGVDHLGVAWILYIDLEDLFTIDVNAPGRCEDPGYVPRRGGFGLFGMSFVAESVESPCSTLYMMSYDGEGPFEEGPGLGILGYLDPETMGGVPLSEVDFDGGELAGTGDGRLFAFAGAEPAKLVEYDRETGERIDLIPLDGFSRTNASAFAFYGGDIYFFTEAPPPGCEPCLESTCSDAYAECLADAVCAAHLTCAIEAADIRDDCGGGMSTEMQACISTCTDVCLTSLRARVSRVTHLDYDDSEGGGAGPDRRRRRGPDAGRGRGVVPLRPRRSVLTRSRPPGAPVASRSATPTRTLVRIPL